MKINKIVYLLIIDLFVLYTNVIIILRAKHFDIAPGGEILKAGSANSNMVKIF